MSTPAPPAPGLGPCAAWITADDVANCCGLDNADPDALAKAAEDASSALFQISGRQFTGLCERVVRPCRQACQCWGSVAAGTWVYGGYSGYGGGYGYPGVWGNESGDTCGCGPLSRVKLSGYPVRQVTQVKIDGQVVDPSAYRLDGWRWLVRLSDPGPPAVDNVWPSCQNLALDDTQTGTFSVAYLHGVEPPQLGADAACQLACELYRACNPGSGTCQVPSNVTKINRQGVTIDSVALLNWLDPSKSTGLTVLDTFLHTYWGRKPPGRRPAVWSPDVQQPGRTVGT